MGLVQANPFQINFKATFKPLTALCGTINTNVWEDILEVRMKEITRMIMKSFCTRCRSKDPENCNTACISGIMKQKKRLIKMIKEFTKVKPISVGKKRSTVIAEYEKKLLDKQYMINTLQREIKYLGGKND